MTPERRKEDLMKMTKMTMALTAKVIIASEDAQTLYLTPRFISYFRLFLELIISFFNSLCLFVNL